MASGTLFSIVMSMIPMFESFSGVPIIMHSPGDDGYQSRVEIRQKVCDRLQMRECDIPLGVFHYLLMADGTSYSLNMAPRSNPGGDGSRVCIINPPKADSPGFSYVYSTIAPMQYTNTIGTYRQNADEIRSFNLLMQMARCARSADLDDRTEANREAAFASIAVQLMSGDPMFAAYAGETLPRYVASATGSETVSYAAGIAERIQMEQWKQNLARLRDSEPQCDPVTVETSNQPNTRTFDSPVRVFMELVQCGDVEKKYQRTPVRISDYDLAAVLPNADGSSLVNSGSDDNNAGIPKSAVSHLIEPTFEWQPFQNVQQDTRSGMLYAWNTASKIVGVSPDVGRQNGMISMDQGQRPTSTLNGR